MKQVPRYDPANVDPLGLKPSLALLFNNTITGLWMDSANKDQIFIGEHSIDCTGAIRESRYRQTKTGRYDGIHLYGSSGRKAFTLSVLNILKAANVTASDHDYHQSCAQFKYQHRRGKSQQSVNHNGRKFRNRQQPFTVPTQNRFSGLSTKDQGNW